MSTPRNQNDPTGSFVADLTAMFAGVLLVVASIFDMLQGGSAIANDDLFSAGSEYLYKLNMTTWGTVHLIIGAVGFVAGIGILRGATWGQLIGIGVAGLSMLTNFAFIPIYPWWSITIILFDLLIIWALTTQLKTQAP